MLPEDRIASAGIAIGLGATIVAMALPLAYPNAPITVWRLLFWGGLLLVLISLCILGMDMLRHRQFGKAHATDSNDEPIISQAQRARFETTVRRLAPELRDFMRDRRTVQPSFGDVDDERARMIYSVRASLWERETLKLYFKRFGKEMALVRDAAIRLRLAANQPDDVFSEPTSAGEVDTLSMRLFGLIAYFSDSERASVNADAVQSD